MVYLSIFGVAILKVTTLRILLSPAPLVRFIDFSYTPKSNTRNRIPGDHGLLRVLRHATPPRGVHGPRLPLPHPGQSTRARHVIDSRDTRSRIKADLRLSVVGTGVPAFDCAAPKFCRSRVRGSAVGVSGLLHGAFSQREPGVAGVRLLRGAALEQRGLKRSSSCRARRSAFAAVDAKCTPRSNTRKLLAGTHVVLESWSRELDFAV
eukprot:2192998-Rhodomonas_salina.2